MQRTAGEAADVVVRTGDGLAAPAADYARARIGSVLRGAPGRVRGAEVRLERSRRTVPELVALQVAVDVGDGSVTLSVRATGVREVVDLATERLRVRLIRVDALRESARPKSAEASA
jgi:hypothetical protein